MCSRSSPPPIIIALPRSRPLQRSPWTTTSTRSRGYQFPSTFKCELGRERACTAVRSVQNSIRCTSMCASDLIEYGPARACVRVRACARPHYDDSSTTPTTVTITSGSNRARTALLLCALHYTAQALHYCSTYNARLTRAQNYEQEDWSSYVHGRRNVQRPNFFTRTRHDEL